MAVDKIVWTHPCGCGDTPNPRAEIKYSGGWLRVKDMQDGTYQVQKFGPNKMREGDVITLNSSEFAELIA